MTVSAAGRTESRIVTNQGDCIPVQRGDAFNYSTHLVCINDHHITNLDGTGATSDYKVTRR
jgi:hypothetical protein